MECFLEDIERGKLSYNYKLQFMGNRNLNLTKECDCMKKKIIAAICILLAIVLLVPIPMRMKDGGTVKYQAVLYSISDVHRLAPSEESGYEDGIIVEILGMQIYNNVD